MNPGAAAIELDKSDHRIASNRSLQALIAWGVEQTEDYAAAGKRAMWVPCHAIDGALSLRSWIMYQASRNVGAAGPYDAASLLSGAADLIVIVDPAAADREGLNWLGNLLACAEEVRDLTVTPPLPELLVLSQTGSGSEHSDSFLDRLRALGARETRASGREGDLSATALQAELAALRDRHHKMLAALSLVPCPITLQEFEVIAAACGAGSNALRALTSGGAFHVLDGMVLPCNREVRKEVRALLGPEAVQQAAESLVDTFDRIFEHLPDARIELQMLAGDARRATRLARKRFDEHYAAGRFEEALRVTRIATDLRMPLEPGRDGADVDLARLASLHAEVGNTTSAREMVTTLARRRDLYRNAQFIEWLALAARTLALQGHAPRAADSLLRRAIRLAGDDLDRSIRLTLLRVNLLESDVFKLDDRASWLLSHINNKMLAQVSPATVAQYLEVTAARLAAGEHYKGAFKRLRRLSAIETSDRRRAMAMLLMARCRAHFSDHEGALRHASSALHYGLRAADLVAVQQAAKFLRQAERGRPRAMPRIAPPRARGEKPRLPAVADMPVPPTPSPSDLYELLQSRFGATSWVRRRGTQTESMGGSRSNPSVVTVYQESKGGVQLVTRSQPAGGGTRAVVLLRNDGDDAVVFESPADTEPREDAIVRFLLADRSMVEGTEGAPPTRKSVVDEYLKRAAASGSSRGLHATVETLFNKDVLIYFEEQGLTKEEMAERLGVSRATLYRMYARAGLN